MLNLNAPAEAVGWLRGRVTGTLQTDSRLVRQGDGFIAWPGAATDGRLHVPEALARGATACLVERDGADRFQFDQLGGIVATYASLKAATGPLAALYFGEPSRQLEVLAVTGTNGKTTTTWWLSQALSNLPGKRAIPCAVIGTLGAGQPPDLVSNGMTTPDPVLLQRQFRQFADIGVKACAIEASSIGVAEGRLDGTRIAVAVFTNFTQDHLDYHGTMEAYWEAKKRLFGWSELRAAVVNVDDARGRSLSRFLAGRDLPCWTYSINGEASLVARSLQYDDQGLEFMVVEGVNEIPMRHHVIGRFNVSNLLAVLGTLRALGFALQEAVNACHSLTAVPGRLESVVMPGKPMVVIDYAHTPDALVKVLATLRPLADRREGRLWCLFGCGGDRDTAKRPLMGAAAEQGADVVVLTSDNPRSESPAAIIGQIAAGLARPERAQIELNRSTAISRVLEQAGEKDVILLAGKGHEDYQEVQGVRHPFSDKSQVEKCWERVDPVADISPGGVA